MILRKHNVVVIFVLLVRFCCCQASQVLLPPHPWRTSRRSQRQHARDSFRHLQQQKQQRHHHDDPNTIIATIQEEAGLPPAVPSTLFATGLLTAAAAKCWSSEAVQRAAYFWTTAGPMIAHYKWTQWWLTASHANRAQRDVTYERLHNRYAEPALSVIIHLKGLYCKIGQVLSARPDFLPYQYVSRFATVQDAIPQWPVESVKKIVQDSLQTNFGYDYDDVFESMDPVALGSASIGQVHRAVLKEPFRGGRRHHKEVAVKIMHPDAQGRFVHDFQVFRWVCRLALPGWRGLLDELEKRFLTEFDYHTEAASLATIRSNIQKSRFRDKVYVPEPLQELCTNNLLVMEMLKGKKLVDAIKDRLANSLGGNRQLASEFLEGRRNKVIQGTAASTATETQVLIKSLSIFQKVRLLLLRRKCKHIVDTLIAVHGHQILQDGFFNGDPHPGNCLELSDGRLGLIDFGQTRRLDDEERLALSRVIIAVGTDAEPAIIASTMQAAGFCAQDNEDYEMWTKYATLFFDSDLESQRLGFATPQLYFQSLMQKNPLTEIPDAFVFVARVSFLFRGMGAGIGIGPVKTSKYWLPEAKAALRQSNKQ